MTASCVSKPSTIARPGALRSFSTSFGAPRIEYAPSSDIRNTMRRLTFALTAVGTAP